MPSLLDFGPIYSPTGSICQLEYATKCTESGNTIIAIKSKKGLVIAIEKPIISKLILNKENKKLFHLGSTVYSSFSGIPTDGYFISSNLKKQFANFISTHENISNKMVKYLIGNIVSIFTRYFNTRPIGCNIITCMHYSNEFSILMTDPSSKSTFYKACAVGKGAVRAKTELEKEDFSEMDVAQLADNAVRILYRCHDPIKDKEFDIELCYMNEETQYKMVEVIPSDLEMLNEKYKHLNVD